MSLLFPGGIMDTGYPALIPDLVPLPLETPKLQDQSDEQISKFPESLNLPPPPLTNHTQN